MTTTVDAPARHANRARPGLSSRLLGRPEIGALVAAIIIFIFFLLLAPAFRSAESFFTVLYQSSVSVQIESAIDKPEARLLASARKD